MYNKVWVVSFMDADDDYAVDVFNNAEAAAQAYVALRESGYEGVDLHHTAVYDRFDDPTHS